MGCGSLSSACDVVKNLGCIYIGATKIFSGQVRNTTTGQGMDISGRNLSMVLALDGREILIGITVPLGEEGAAGLWEIKLSVDDTKKLRHGVIYDVEFELVNFNEVPHERTILGRGAIRAERRLHSD